MKPVHDIIYVISHVGFFHILCTLQLQIKRVLQITPKPLFHYMQAMIFLTSLMHQIYIFHVLKLNFISFRKQYHNNLSANMSICQNNFTSSNSRRKEHSFSKILVTPCLSFFSNVLCLLWKRQQTFIDLQTISFLVLQKAAPNIVLQRLPQDPRVQSSSRVLYFFL